MHKIPQPIRKKFGLLVVTILLILVVVPLLSPSARSKREYSGVTEIYIMGMHHTGTSLLAGLLSASGATLLTERGVLTKMKRDQKMLTQIERYQNFTFNPHHWPFESRYLRSGLATIQKSVDSNWIWICDLSKKLETHRRLEVWPDFATFMKNWHGDVHKNFTASPANAIVVKDPRLTFLMPLMEEVLEPRNRIYLATLREVGDVVVSFGKRNFYPPTEYLAALWMAYNIELWNFCVSHPCYWIAFTDLMLQTERALDVLKMALIRKKVSLKPIDPEVLNYLKHPGFLNGETACPSQCGTVNISSELQALTSNLHAKMLELSVTQDFSPFARTRRKIEIPKIVRSLLCSCEALEATIIKKNCTDPDTLFPKECCRTIGK